MKNLSKKLLSTLLAMLMLLSVLPAGAFTAQAGTVLLWPVIGHTTRSQGFHDGSAIDISDGSIYGATVYSALGGTVEKVFKCSHNTYPNYNISCCYGYGTGVVIKGNDGRHYRYAHMVAGSIPSNIWVGASVSQGTVLGKVGNTGNSSDRKSVV